MSGSYRGFVEECSHCAELVTDAADRDDSRGPAGIPLDLPSQVDDVRVARALVADVARAPETAEQLVARERPLRLLRQDGEKPELRRSELDGLSVDSHLVPDDVDLEPADAERGRRFRAVEVAPAQERAHAAHELG